MKQHYIPRCYLKRFSDNDKSVFSYDKIKLKTYRASLMSVCCEDDLYTLSQSYVKECVENHNNINKLSIEHDYFSKNIEPMFAQCLKQLDEIQKGWINGNDKYKLQFIEKKELALHIITLYFRLPDVIDSLIDNYLRFDKAGIDMIKHILAVQTRDEAFEDLKIGVSCERAALHANLSYLNCNLIMNIANIIANNIFVFWMSDNLFYTSDFPIVLNPYIQNVKSSCMGLSQYGGELMMTLSPSLAISIFDRAFFIEKEGLDSNFIKADDKEIFRRNWMNYLYAKRHVFCLKNDFRMIDMIYKLYGKHVFCSPNLKTEIISGLGKY